MVTPGSTPSKGTARSDLHTIFPPQWSPFQPFLSLPSLKAYLAERGYQVTQSDWNVAFYDHFISDARLARARRRLEHYVLELHEDYDDYKARAAFSLAVLNDHAELTAKVGRLRDPGITDSVKDFEESVYALRRLLQAFSVAEPVIEIGVSSFSAARVMTSLQAIDQFTRNPEENPFIDFYRAKISGLGSSRYWGLSIIGTEQVLPGLTLGRMLKEAFPDIPLIVGGSVFSRLIDKDPLIKQMFGVYFDFICRYEGERSMDALLSAENPRSERTPSIAFLEDGEIVKTELCPPLSMAEIPTPDFSGLDLAVYLSPEIVLPLLTTRGCYWDKCAFCYHGMIYGDRYRMRSPERFAKDVEALHERHGVRHFALNDEAIPPKLFRLLPDVLPKKKYAFTGLYKFETYFKPADYHRMYEVGLRSLYIGLETASERVQKHMRKNNLQSTMLRNLRDAHNAGIWNHAFVFFGFPTETEEEAEESIQFLLDNADIIHSEGTGTFSFEHNAPIANLPEGFGVVEVLEKPNRVLELYYDYRVRSGLDAQGAELMVERFTELKRATGHYHVGTWIPREHLLLLLDRHGRKKLRADLTMVDRAKRKIDRSLGSFRWLSTTAPGRSRAKHFVVHWATGRIYETNEDVPALFELLDPETSIEHIAETFPSLAGLAAPAAGQPAHVHPVSA